MTCATTPLTSPQSCSGREAAEDRDDDRVIVEKKRGDDARQRIDRADRDVDLAGDQREPDADGEKAEEGHALQDAGEVVSVRKYGLVNEPIRKKSTTARTMPASSN